MTSRLLLVLRSSLLFLVLGACTTPWCTAAEQRVVRGRVILDANANGRPDPEENGVAGVAISDGVQFVTSGEDGSYQLPVADDPMIPYQPARVIALSWPSNTWPTSPWSRRLADLPESEALNFTLRSERQELPLTLAHATDPHDNCASAKSLMWAEEVGRMKGHVNFAVMTGDLGYAGVDNAHQMFASVADYTRKFPVPLFHTVGNHDVVGIHTAEWKNQSEIHGNGAYTKYLGPIRWSFSYAGIHFVGLDWALIDPKEGVAEVGVPEVATEWLRRDLLRQQPGTRTFVFLHQPWSPTDAFWDVLVAHKVELALGGHSHRNVDMSQRGITALTTMNLRGPYRTLTIKQNSHEIIDRCMGCKDPAYHSRHCRLKAPELDTQARREGHLELAKVELTSKEQALEQLPGDGIEIDARITPGQAKRCGVRIVTATAPEGHVEIACAGESLFVDGLEIPAVPLPGEAHFDLRALVSAGRLILTSNLRVVYEKPLKLRGPLRAILFAEEGGAEFRNVETWGLK